MLLYWRTQTSITVLNTHGYSPLIYLVFLDEFQNTHPHQWYYFQRHFDKLCFLILFTRNFLFMFSDLGDIL